MQPNWIPDGNYTLGLIALIFTVIAALASTIWFVLKSQITKLVEKEVRRNQGWVYITHSVHMYQMGVASRDNDVINSMLSAAIKYSDDAIKIAQGLSSDSDPHIHIVTAASSNKAYYLVELKDDKDNNFNEAKALIHSVSSYLNVLKTKNLGKWWEHEESALYVYSKSKPIDNTHLRQRLMLLLNDSRVPLDFVQDIKLAWAGILEQPEDKKG